MSQNFHASVGYCCSIWLVKANNTRTRPMLITPSLNMVDATGGELRCSGSASSSCPTNQNALDRYEKLFNTAYSVSKNDSLFSNYTFISAIKIKIDLHLGSNHLDTDVCANYIKTIPEVLRNDVIDHLKQAQFISIMPDSSTDSCHWSRGNPFKICPPWHSRTSNCVCNYQIFI